MFFSPFPQSVHITQGLRSNEALRETITCVFEVPFDFAAFVRRSSQSKSNQPRSDPGAAVTVNATLVGYNVPPESHHVIAIKAQNLLPSIPRHRSGRCWDRRLTQADLPAAQLLRHESGGQPRVHIA